VLAHLGQKEAALAAYDKALEINSSLIIVNHNRQLVLEDKFQSVHQFPAHIPEIAVDQGGQAP